MQPGLIFLALQTFFSLTSVHAGVSNNSWDPWTSTQSSRLECSIVQTDSVNGRQVCVINETKVEFVQRKVLTFNGDVVFAGGRRILRYLSGLEVNATGSITFREGTLLRSLASIMLIGEMITLEPHALINCEQDLVIQACSIVCSCPIKVSGHFIVESNDQCADANIENHGLHLMSKTSIVVLNNMKVTLPLFVASNVTVRVVVSLEAESEVIKIMDANIFAGGDIRFSSTHIQFASGTMISTDRELTLGRFGKHPLLQEENSDEQLMANSPMCEVELAGNLESARDMFVLCSSGVINITDYAILHVKPSSRLSPSIVVVGAKVIAEAESVLKSAFIEIIAFGDVQLLCATIPGVVSNATQAVWTSLKVSTLGSVQLGTPRSSWQLERLIVVAGRIAVLNALLKTVNSTSCENQISENSDQCRHILSAWRDEDDDGAEVVAHIMDSYGDKITFDLSLVAGSGGLSISSPQLMASSMMICSQGEVFLGEGATLDAKGRGCQSAPAVGNMQRCGGAGGSHIGVGGSGACYVVGEAISPCEEATPSLSIDRKMLSTRGASGGSCGFTSACNLIAAVSVTAPSAGGGLIWLSGETMRFAKRVTLTVDGTGGIVFKDSCEGVSGGGAGGQIILWANEFQGSLEEPALLSARGGEGMCSETLVSGSGGGGFIGLRMRSRSNAAYNNYTKIDVSGGELNKDCSLIQKLPRVEEVHGKSGQALSLDSCEKGHGGLFCVECEAGTYSDDGQGMCRPCKTAPEQNAVYTHSGWYNADCPYVCRPGLLDVNFNRHCLTAIQYFQTFSREEVGVEFIGFGVLAGAAAIVFRRVKKDARAREDEHGGETFHSSRESFRKSRVRGTRCIFTDEKIPYHFCRVFLNGNNTGEYPWMLAAQLPDCLRGIACRQAWTMFVAELIDSAKVNKKEMILERFLMVLYPPMRVVLQLYFRNARAQRLQACVELFSEGLSGRPLVCGTKESGVLQMAFGSDSGRTLGFIDFFDFDRSQYDWEPVNLREEVWLLVAKGHGSFAEPFALDMGDPLVNALGQTEFGAGAIGSVIATFNRTARLMRSVDIKQPYGSEPESAKLARLRTKVDRCAARSGLAGFVRVLIVRLSHCSKLESVDNTSFAAPTESACSFSDLIHPTSDNQIHRSRVPSNLCSKINTAREPCMSKEEAKLCIAFGEHRPPDACASHPAALCTARSSRQRPNSTFSDESGRVPLSLSIPMPQAAFLEEVERNNRFGKEYSHRGHNRDNLSSWHEKQPPMVICVLLVLFMFVDLLAFLTVGHFLGQIRLYYALYILLPPMAQPLTLVLGPAFVFSEDVRLGRFYAEMQLCCIIGPIVVAVLSTFLLQSPASILGLLLFQVCIIKGCVFGLVQFHLWNLEASYDLGFTNASQEDFICNLVSERNNRRNSTCASEVFEEVSAMEMVTAPSSFTDCRPPGTGGWERSQSLTSTGGGSERGKSRSVSKGWSTRNGIASPF